MPWQCGQRRRIVCTRCYFYLCISPPAVLVAARSTGATSFATWGIPTWHFIGQPAPSWPSKDTTRAPTRGGRSNWYPIFYLRNSICSSSNICCWWGRCNRSSRVCMEMLTPPDNTWTSGPFNETPPWMAKMFRVWWPRRSLSTQIWILGLQIIVIWPLTLVVPSSKVIAQNFPSTRHQGILRPRPHDSMPIVLMTIDSWTSNKCTPIDWPSKLGIACCNSSGAQFETLRSIVRPSRFGRASTNPTVIIRRNPSACLSSHLSCVRSHRPPLNWPCRHHPRIKRTKCVLCELFVDWATDNGRARNKAWPWRWSSKTSSICWWSCPPDTANRSCSWSSSSSPLAPSSWWCLWRSSSADMKLMQLKPAYDTRPTAPTRLRLTILRPSCSYRWNVQPLPGSWNSHIRWTICKSFIASSWMKRICCC